jgi:hypothetical protein
MSCLDRDADRSDSRWLPPSVADIVAKQVRNARYFAIGLWLSPEMAVAGVSDRRSAVADANSRQLLQPVSPTRRNSCSNIIHSGWSALRSRMPVKLSTYDQDRILQRTTSENKISRHILMDESFLTDPQFSRAESSDIEHR